MLCGVCCLGSFTGARSSPGFWHHGLSAMQFFHVSNLMALKHVCGREQQHLILPVHLGSWKQKRNTVRHSLAHWFVHLVLHFSSCLGKMQDYKLLYMCLPLRFSSLASSVHSHFAWLYVSIRFLIAGASSCTSYYRCMALCVSCKHDSAVMSSVDLGLLFLPPCLCLLWCCSCVLICAS